MPDQETLDKISRMHTEWWRNWGPDGQLKSTRPYGCFCSLGKDHYAEEQKPLPEWTPELQQKLEERAYGPISIDGPDVAERIWLSASREIGGEQLSMEQVAAVLHALADYSLNQRMVSEAVADLAIRPLAFSEPNQPELAHGLGRWFHGVADRLKQRSWNAMRGKM